MELSINDKLKLFKNEELSNEKIKVPNKNIEVSKLTKFKNLDYVYLWTNEDLKEYYAKDIVDTSVLSVTASGDHPLHAVLGGAKEVHSFDVNEFSKYLSMLKEKLIKNVSYADFKKYMDYLHKKIFGVVLDEVAWYLTSDELEFWGKYVKYFENENISLFLFGGSCSILNNAYFNEELYYNLQKKLGNAKIYYHDTAVENLSREFNGCKFSIIYLSNILGRIEKPVSMVNSEATKLLSDLECLLDNEGRIYDYNLRVANHGCYTDDALDEIFDITSLEVGTQKDNVYIYSKKGE